MNCNKTLQLFQVIFGFVAISFSMEPLIHYHFSTSYHHSARRVQKININFEIKIEGMISCKKRLSFRVPLLEKSLQLFLVRKFQISNVTKP
jgi:hypothetical protein